VAANASTLVVVSRLRGVSLRDRMTPRSSCARPAGAGPGRPGGARVGDLLAVTERIVGPRPGTCAAGLLPAGGRPCRSRRTRRPWPLQTMERVLAGAIGASSARFMFTHALQGRGVAAEEVAEHARRDVAGAAVSRQLLQATMENVSQGIASPTPSAHRRVNRRYLRCSTTRRDGLRGSPVADLIRWNAQRGRIRPHRHRGADRETPAHMRAGMLLRDPARQRNGGCTRSAGQSMPDGGYVNHLHGRDATSRPEVALLEAKSTLEQRVEERTRELQSALEAQRDAKRLAEEANATKTRFVAAASHDLLQPLNAARLFASALEERSTDPARARDRRRIDSSMRAAEEVLETCSTSRASKAARCVPRSRFQPRGYLRDLERQFAPLAARRGLRLRVKTPELPRAQRPRAAAARPAEPDLECAALTRARVACWSPAAGVARVSSCASGTLVRHSGNAPTRYLR